MSCPLSVGRGPLLTAGRLWISPRNLRRHEPRCSLSTGDSPLTTNNGHLAADVLKQVPAADHERVKSRLERAFEGAVLDLDGDVAGVAGIAQGAEESAPANVAQAGNLGCVPQLGIGQDPVLVEGGSVDPGVLGMDVEDPVLELSQGCDVVDLLPDQVRGVEVQAEIGAGNVVEHPPPDRGRRCQVLAAGPLVGR